MGITHARTHPFNGPFSGTTQVSRYQKGKTNLDFTEATDSEWQWHQLEHMQVCTSLQTDNHANTPPLSMGITPSVQHKYLKYMCPFATKITLVANSERLQVTDRQTQIKQKDAVNA